MGVGDENRDQLSGRFLDRTPPVPTIAISTGRRPIGATALDRVLISNPLHFGRAERALGAGSETLSIQQRSDLSVGVFRRQGSDSSGDHGIRPAQLVLPPGFGGSVDRVPGTPTLAESPVRVPGMKKVVSVRPTRALA